ncbi:hypothetical protein LTR85_012166 [Meristemomyces frigidus]|nr:hypothetical protein LTR85_012166 [Meristemomyces frigidus]
MKPSGEQQSPLAPAPNSRNPEVVRTLHAGCSQHGRLLRGLMSTPQSRSFEGRFGRMFALRAGTYGATDTESRDALMALGDAMTSTLDPPKDGFDGEESGIPALYTYFGQFIDHDITFDPVSTLKSHGDPDGLTDFRTPALDLDNMYGRGPDDQPYMYDDSGRRFLLGNKLDDGALDLPRSNADPARAIIGDPRNDENSIVSQLQAVMLRFHNHLADARADLDFPSLQREVRYHYQWVVVHDFLPKIISASVLDALKTEPGGRYDQSKLKFYKWKKAPFMPVEFSVAAYRLGHSMIRPGYRLNDTTLLPIFPVPPSVAGAPPEGITPGLSGFQALDRARGIDWPRFIDTERRAWVGENDPPSEATTKRLQFAYRLDTMVVTPLSVLPAAVAPDQPRSLAQRNLLRGFELGLPTGQAVARAMGLDPLTDDKIVIGKAVDKVGAGDVLGTISGLPQLSAFRGNCPLWTYILAEAMENRSNLPVPVTPPGISVSTPQLGLVGGRIVAEVFLGMLFADESSFLRADPTWKPWLPTVSKADTDPVDPVGIVASNGPAAVADSERFHLRDIVQYGLASKEPVPNETAAGALANGAGVGLANGLATKAKTAMSKNAQPNGAAPVPSTQAAMHADIREILEHMRSRGDTN